MVVDVFFAIAMEAAAARAITELQFRIGFVRSSANGAPMRIIRCGFFCGTEGDGGTLHGGSFLLSHKLSSEREW